jgi:N-acetylmuramoyl-L-alanine amidase
MVVLHYTAMTSAEAAIGRLSDPQAEVSAHYLVAEDGRIVAMVPEEARAWHAGVSAWGRVSDVNSHSIGIELANPGPLAGGPPFPAAQMAALGWLLGTILPRHGIPPERVVGHACTAPGRKQDPGPGFDWRALALMRFSVWQDPDWAAIDRAASQAGAAADARRFQSAAIRFGYRAALSGAWDAPTLALWRAFVERFLPARPTLPPNAAAIAHLEALAERWPVSLAIGA